jgi:hypothetical protein
MNSEGLYTYVHLMYMLLASRLLHFTYFISCPFLYVFNVELILIIMMQKYHSLSPPLLSFRIRIFIATCIYICLRTLHDYEAQIHVFYVLHF